MIGALHTDAYQISMAYAHWKSGNINRKVTAEGFFRKLPEGWNYILMGGFNPIHDFVARHQENLFTKEEVDYISDAFRIGDAAFLTWLRENARLSDLDIHVVPDGELLFPNVPAIQVRGPAALVKLIETPICGMLNHMCRVATVASRIRREVPRKTLIEFGSRRLDPEAAVHAALAAYIGGFDATSNVEAGRRYGIPISGTMAHAYVLSYGNGVVGELHAFKDFIQAFPEKHTLLVDTYNVEQGVANAMRASLDLRIPLSAIRIDSGDANTVFAARRQLDIMGFAETKIFVSNEMDEQIIRLYNQKGVPVDGYGVGTKVVASHHSPGFVYKIVEVFHDQDAEWMTSAHAPSSPVMKVQQGGKSNLPGEKVVVRHVAEGRTADMLLHYSERDSIAHEHRSSTNNYRILGDRLPFPAVDRIALQNTRSHAVKRVAEFKSYAQSVSNYLREISVDIEKSV
jgi:nicotinate phosphoribosyltransferase